MDWFREYKDYFILAVALATLITVWFGYILKIRLKQKETFSRRTEKRIKMVLGPIMKELKEITEEDHEQARFRKLERFVDFYDGIESPLFLSPSRDLINQFDFVVQEFKAYKKLSSQENHNALWSSVLSLQELSNKKFEDYNNCLKYNRVEFYD